MKVLSLILVTIGILISCLPAQARVVTANDITPKVKKYILNHYKTLYDGDIQVTLGRMPAIPCDVQDGQLEIDVTSNLRDHFVKRTLVRVILKVDGKNVRAIGVPVELALYDNVYVATEPIQRDTAITGSNVKIERRDISDLGLTAALSSKDVYNKISNKTFRTEEVLDMRFIEKSPDIQRNSLVNIIFRSDVVAVSIPGEAMEEGCIGDSIRVKSSDYRKNYVGTVIGKNVVLINI